MKLCTLFVVALLTPVAVVAGEVDGRWTGTVSTPAGDFPIEFTFKGDGDALVGTMADGYRETAIDGGKIDGANISFSVDVDFGGGTVHSVIHRCSDRRSDRPDQRGEWSAVGVRGPEGRVRDRRDRSSLEWRRRSR